jgi:hypothetical protein
MSESQAPTRLHAGPVAIRPPEVLSVYPISEFDTHRQELENDGFDCVEWHVGDPELCQPRLGSTAISQD